MGNRKKRATLPAQPLSRAAFERELTKAVDGDPSADPHIRCFLDDLVDGLGAKAALSHPTGIEFLRDEGGAR